MHEAFQCGIICNSKDWKQPKCPPIVEEITGRPYSGILCSYKKEGGGSLYILLWDDFYGILLSDKGRVPKK